MLIRNIVSAFNLINSHNFKIEILINLHFRENSFYNNQISAALAECVWKNSI